MYSYPLMTKRRYGSFFGCLDGQTWIISESDKCNPLSRRDDSDVILQRGVSLLLILALLLIGGIQPNPGPFPCKLCSVVPETIASNVRHQHYHAYNKSFVYYCPSPDCIFVSKSFGSLNFHVSQFHREIRHQDPSALEVISCSYCDSFVTTSLWEYVQHLYKHLESGIVIKCPIEHCPGKINFKKKSTFQVHLSQYHKTWRAEGCTKQKKPKTVMQATEASTSMFFSPEDSANISSEQEPAAAEHVDLLNDELILDGIAKFYLHLYAQHLLPGETIQEISEGLSYLTDIVHARMKLVLGTELKAMGVEEDKINTLCYKVLQADLLYSSHHKDSPGPSLTSDHLRKKYFSKNFDFEEPEEVNLNEDDPEAKETLQYIPIKSTLTRLFQDPTLQREIDLSFSRQPVENDKVSDYNSGTVFQSEHHPSKEIQLFLYQDAFNPVLNVLGSAKNKYKLLAMYFTIGNLQPHLRAKIITKHLIMLMKESVFKSVGAQKCFSKVIEELKELEIDGISFKGERVKVTVQFILGDSLGQHQVGGFIECFSAKFFCRFCDIKKQVFLANPHLTKSQRTIEDYNACVLRASLTGKHHKGIKTTCEFNCLQYFHATSHLVPCLAHDLFEGVVSWDLSGIIAHFIKNKRWFTYKLLNQRIKLFRCSGVDIANKPALVSSKGEKLGGHAVQNWTLLRLFPFIIGDKIQDYNDPGWQLYCKMKELCEYFCAPSLMKSDIPYIKDVLIPGYFELRSEVLSPDKYPLKPKHHYMVHYAELIIMYGVLLYLWTLSYEQKHKFFKHLMRMSQNFINPAYSCAVRYQMNLCLQGTSHLFPEVCDEFQAKVLDPKNYTNELMAFLSTLNLPPNCRECSSICYQDVTYKQEDVLLLSSKEEGRSVHVGAIKVIIRHGSSLKFVLELYSAVFNGDRSIYVLPLDCSKDFRVVPVQELKYPVPHPIYNHKGHLSFSLKHKLIE